MDKSKFKGIGRCRGGTTITPISPSFNKNVDTIDDSFDKLKLTEDDKENFNDLSSNRKKIDSNISITVFGNNKVNDIAIPSQRVSYIPDDNNEDYQLHLKSGINFDNFDTINVSVTGHDIPDPISSLDDFQIPEFLKANIRSAEYRKLTPVQKYTIPIIDRGRDIMACAQTGSGKTVAFLVPIIKNIVETVDENPSNRNAPKCIVLVPTRELCRQIFTVAHRLCQGSSLRCGYSYGGINMHTSIQKLHKSDILVCTTGRLLFHIKSNGFTLEKLRYFVLDTADHLLRNKSFLETVKTVYEKSKAAGVGSLHVSMFSATFPAEMQCLGESLMKDYLFVAVGLVGSANTDIEQKVIRVTSEEKLNAVLGYLTEKNTGKTLIFVRRQPFADFLAIRLINLKFNTTTLYGGRDQFSRESALNNFKSGRVPFLVATDVASRGLDIPLVDTVINYDMPKNMDVYVQRIGRAGRCGNPGVSVSFFDISKDMSHAPRLVQILKDAEQVCPRWLSDCARAIDQKTRTAANIDLSIEAGDKKSDKSLSDDGFEYVKQDDVNQSSGNQIDVEDDTFLSDKLVIDNNNENDGRDESIASLVETQVEKEEQETEDSGKMAFDLERITEASNAGQAEESMIQFEERETYDSRESIEIVNEAPELAREMMETNSEDSVPVEI